jgi:hypothetical protein
MEGGVRLGIWRLTFSEAFTIGLDVLSKRNNAVRKRSILYLQPRSWKFLARRVTWSRTILKARFMLRRFLIGWTRGAAKSGLRASMATLGRTLAAFWELLPIA